MSVEMDLTAKYLKIANLEADIWLNRRESRLKPGTLVVLAMAVGSVFGAAIVGGFAAVLHLVC